MPGLTSIGRLLHADWSTAANKRWVAGAERIAGTWQVSAPRLVGNTHAFVSSLFVETGPVLAGFDFPIGMPLAYGRATGLANFPSALEVFGNDEWANFFVVAETPDQVSLRRPFYPRVSTAASRQMHLLRGLGVETIDALRRRCERATATRRAACPLFWTLGGNQVGKAAISGWQEVIAPARRRGARLWPFDGDLASLAESDLPILAETYPGEAYGHIGVVLHANMSKRRQVDRITAMGGLATWAQRHAVGFSAVLSAQIADGFGGGSDGEDRFDALVGVLGMIEVADGRRREAHAGSDRLDGWEGWILGQVA